MTAIFGIGESEIDMKMAEKILGLNRPFFSFNVLGATRCIPDRKILRKNLVLSLQARV